MKKYFSLKTKRILKIHFRFKNDLKNFSVRYRRFLWLLKMFSKVRRVTGLSRKYFWRSRKFFIVQNVNAVDFYKMKLGEVFFKAFVKPWKRPKIAFFEQKMNFSEKSFGRIKNPRPETQGKLGSLNKIPLLFWALERYLRKSPKCPVRLQNA